MLISGGVFETRVPRKEAKGTKGEFRAFRALSWVSCSSTTAGQAAGISQVLMAGMLDEGSDIDQTRQI